MTIQATHEVLFRLPGSEKLEHISMENGEDRFLIAPFERSRKPIEIQGKIRQINFSEAETILRSWKMPELMEKSENSEENYKLSVEKAIKAIESGVIHKVVLATSKYIQHATSLESLFYALCENAKDAFVYVFRAESLIMLGASPETLLKRSGEKLRTEALGGTKTRGVYSDKEWLEHRQIKEYIENVLQKNSYVFTQSETFSKQASQIEHLSTGYKIESKNPKSDLELASSIHPTSAVCGLPFATAIRFIEENEGFKRNYYSGYLGPVRQNGDFDLFVNLRCAEWYNQAIVLFAGAGINGQSNPEDEWDEVQLKMQTIARWLK